MSTIREHVPRGPRVSEKVEQSHIVQLLRSVGAKVYVFGTTRREGDFRGTMQTEGAQDLQAFLPVRGVQPERGQPVKRLFIIVECKARGGSLRPEQRELRDLCLAADIPHITGRLDDVIAWLVDRGYISADSVPHYRQPGAVPSSRVPRRRKPTCL